MKILITGATGFVGLELTKKLLAEGHEINVLTRDVTKAKKLFPDERVKAYLWANNLQAPPLDSIEGINGVINLMGENIGASRWSAEQKVKLKQSRVDSTQNLVNLLEENLKSPLDFFISASAVGIYPVNKTTTLNEETPAAHSFLADLCSQWEEASSKLTKSKRRALIRTAVVLEKNDGALKKMLPPFILGLGGPIGDGNQMMSWIHRDDLVNLYLAAVANENYSGAINATAPIPVNNFDFTKALGHALHRPTIIPVPTLPLKLAFGEMSTVILDSQAVISKRLPELGFEFKYPTINLALEAIFKRK